VKDRIAKRHKRQVARAKARVTLSTSDLRTPEEQKAAAEAARPAGGWRQGQNSHYSPPANKGGATRGAANKTTGEG
jgi:hypothetical protein